MRAKREFTVLEVDCRVAGSQDFMKLSMASVHSSVHSRVHSSVHSSALLPLSFAFVQVSASLQSLGSA